MFETPTNSRESIEYSEEDFGKCSEEDTLVVTLVSSCIDPWGASVNFDDDWTQWKVRTVNRKGQLARKGVNSGFRIRGVDGQLVNEETQWSLRVFLEQGLGCEIEFDTSQRSSLFQPHETQHWRKSSLQREENAMAEEMNRLVRSHSNFLSAKSASPVPDSTIGIQPDEQKDLPIANESTTSYFNDETKCADMFEDFPEPKSSDDLESVKIGLKLVWNEINNLKECYNGLSGVVGRMNARLSNVESLLQTKVSKIKEAENTLEFCSEKIIAGKNNTRKKREIVAV